MGALRKQAIAARRRVWIPLLQWIAGIKSNILKDGLWNRMLKNIICTTITLIIGIIPAVAAVYGHVTYLSAMVSVFAHPGQRFGQMAEALGLLVLGAISGVVWGSLGLYLSGLAIHENVSAAYSIRAVFFLVALLVHGILRASTPRLFLGLVFLLLMSLITLTGQSTTSSVALITSTMYPILTGAAVVVLVNISIFPSFSNALLGHSTITTLNETLQSLTEANQWFLSHSNEVETSPELHCDLHTKLAVLTDKKSKLRAQLAASQKTQAECNFELAYAVLPPRSLKPINGTIMSRFVQATIALIGACESKYSMIGEQNENDNSGERPQSSIDSEDGSMLESDSLSILASSESDAASTDEELEKTSKPKTAPRSKHLRRIDLVKPVREVESGDIDLLEHLIFQVRAPLSALQLEMRQAVRVITSTLAFCYDVRDLPDQYTRPAGIMIEEIDARISLFTQALSQFDQESGNALAQAASTVYKKDAQGDIMPRMETHLICSLLINQRQAGSELLSILQHARSLLESRLARKNRRRFYLPRISWRKWLRTGGEHGANILPEGARKEARAGHGLVEDNRNTDSGDGDSIDKDEHLARSHTDEEMCNIHPVSTKATEKGKIPRRKGPQRTEAGNVLYLRGIAADIVEFIADSDSLAFALKLSVAGFLVTWPAFMPSLNSFYSTYRGTWASFQLILVFEVSVGTSFQSFFLRAIGTVVGCTIGFLAYIIGGGNRVVAIVILVIGLIPASYVHIGTSYPKAGIIIITSLAVVCLAIIAGGLPDAPWEIYLKRMVCFLIGGTVALLVELFLFPVRARDRLVESLASCIRQVSQMENTIAIGIDSPDNIDVKILTMSSNFSEAKQRAEQALSAARTFLPFCLTEPRLKGSFKGQTIIYGEMIYVLSQIIDRMDNMLYLRRAFGSGVLEELNHEVVSYRRNVAGSISLTLFAVHEALTTRLPLPQFLPSSRLAQLRYISRVRELLVERSNGGLQSGLQSAMTTHRNSMVEPTQAVRSITKQNFISWNAGSAGMMEVIEYMEELVDLSKLLVGVNAFRSGMLERPKFHEYISRLDGNKGKDSVAAAADGNGGALEITKTQSTGVFKRSAPLGKVLSVPEKYNTTLRRRRQTFSSDGAGDIGDAEKRDIDLPMSLQRVKTKRIQGLERLRSHDDQHFNAKGLKGTRTWAI